MRFCTFPLDGDWSFTYTAGAPDAGPPPASAFTERMPVPGAWDDHERELRGAPWWSERRCNPEYRPVTCPMGGKPPDASLPYLVGTGWYRRTVASPAGLSRAVIEISRAHMDVHAWVNGVPVGQGPGYAVPARIPLDAAWRNDRENEIVLAVCNLRRDRIGCSIRGWKGRSGGIFGPVTLRCHASARIADLYLHPSADGRRLHGRCTVDGECGPGATVAWALVDPDSAETRRAGTAPVRDGEARWTDEAGTLSPWSDRNPRLYELQAELRMPEGRLDLRRQPFGLRRLVPDGTLLRLNGSAVYLRGLTEHAFFPRTCTPPWDIGYYREAIRRFKELGFNWIRFHTWTPPEPFLRAADEGGMLVQVEPPRGFGPEEWEAILRACRVHPSVVIYCTGNEELLDEAKIAELEFLAGCCRDLAPDALFNPQEALRGIEYGWNADDLGGPEEGRKEKPYLHNPHRLERIKRFSDVIGQYSWGHLSYTSIDGDAATVDARLASYERPCLSHEVCLHGSYLDLAQAHRYRGTRIGTDLFDAVAGHLRERGLLDRAPRYFENSCAWMRLARKHCLETVRRCARITGYDLLGAMDTHWHRTGYPCGIMNEFLELKPGETTADVRRYNGESVLLLDLPRERNLRPGQSVAFPAWVSFFARTDAEEAQLHWSLRDADGARHAGKTRRTGRLRAGGLRALGSIEFDIPPLRDAGELILALRLETADGLIENAWSIFVFPGRIPRGIRLETAPGPAARFASRYAARDGDAAVTVHLTTHLGASERDILAAGGRVLCLGGGGLPTLATSFQPSVAGRPNGHLATVIRDHWITRRFPHPGYCDWRFFRMLHGGRAIAWQDLPLPFDPIIEIAGSFKDARPEACLAEFTMGPGRLLVNTLALDPADPGALHLLDLMVAHLARPDPEPAPPWPIDRLPLPLAGSRDENDTGTDMGFDARAQFPPA